MKSPFIIFCYLLFGVALGLAQPNVEVYYSNANRADTVMDFGVTLEGSPTTRTFTVVNKGPATVGILATNPNADPYYIIVNVPGVPPEDPRKEEFERVEGLSYFIRAGETRLFTVVFRAFVNSPLFPPDRVVEALLTIRVVDSTAPLAASFDKTFRLRALKTTSILATTTPWISYDSVYVNPMPLAPSIPYTIDNAMLKRVKVDKQLFEMQTTVVGTSEIIVDTFPGVEFSPEDSVVWTTRYSPYNRGLDSAHFLVVYRPDSTTKSDTVLTTISGIGVEQKLTLIGATGVPLPVVVRGDTVDFGATPSDGTGIVARIIVRNEGNNNIGIVSESKVGIARDTAAYSVRRFLSAGGPTIRTNSFDTLDVSFVPIEGGDHRIRFVVGTDLRDRGIDGVPDGAQTTQWFFKGFGQRPQIQVTPSALNFGTVVLLKTCTSFVERTFAVRNVGNAELRVDSILITPGTSRVTIDPPSFRIAAGQSQLVKATYEPETIGATTGAITLFTNSLVRAYDVRFDAVVVNPDSIVVSVPLETKVRPGSAVAVDVMATADKLTTTDRCVLSMNFNPSLLQYRSVQQLGTASEGAQVINATELPRGTLRLALQAPTNFLSRSTLVTVIFDSFLGETASSDVSFTNGATTFGNAGCSSVLSVRVESGQFFLDSLCGLSYKTVGSGLRMMSGLFPNPASDNVNVALVVPTERTVSITLVDAFGREFVSIAPLSFSAGVHLIPFSVAHLPPSAYTVIVRSGNVYTPLPLMVGR